MKFFFSSEIGLDLIQFEIFTYSTFFIKKTFFLRKPYIAVKIANQYDKVNLTIDRLQKISDLFETEIKKAKKKWEFGLEIFPSITDSTGCILKIENPKRIGLNDKNCSSR